MCQDECQKMCQIMYMAEKLTNHSVKTVRNWPKIFQNSILHISYHIYIYVAAYVNSVFMTRLFLCQDVCDMGGIARSKGLFNVRLADMGALY